MTFSCESEMDCHEKTLNIRIKCDTAMQTVAITQFMHKAIENWCEKMTVDEKRKQLERRGWSDKRIEQYLKDWRFKVPWSSNPKSQAHGR